MLGANQGCCSRCLETLAAARHHLAGRRYCFLPGWCLRQALQLKPDYLKVVLRKARAHARLKEWDLAFKVRRCRGRFWEEVSCRRLQRIRDSS